MNGNTGQCPAGMLSSGNVVQRELCSVKIEPSRSDGPPMKSRRFLERRWWASALFPFDFRVGRPEGLLPAAKNASGMGQAIRSQPNSQMEQITSPGVETSP
jgi:hypothetical protein